MATTTTAALVHGTSQAERNDRLGFDKYAFRRPGLARGRDRPDLRRRPDEDRCLAGRPRGPRHAAIRAQPEEREPAPLQPGQDLTETRRQR